jgi:hypothetical protein
LEITPRTPPADYGSAVLEIVRRRHHVLTLKIRVPHDVPLRLLVIRFHAFHVLGGFFPQGFQRFDFRLGPCHLTRIIGKRLMVAITVWGVTGVEVIAPCQLRVSRSQRLQGLMYG